MKKCNKSWAEFTTEEKIIIIVSLILTLALQIFSIYALVDANFVAQLFFGAEIPARILLVLLLMLSTAFDVVIFFVW